VARAARVPASVSGGPGHRPLAIHGGMFRNGGGVRSGLERTRREDETIRS